MADDVKRSMFDRLLESVTGGASRPQLSPAQIDNMKAVGEKFAQSGCGDLSAKDLKIAASYENQPAGEKLRVGAEGPSLSAAVQQCAPLHPRPECP